MAQTIASERFILEVSLHGVHLHHTVGNWRTCGEYNALAAGYLVKVSALAEKVGGFHCLGL